MTSAAEKLVAMARADRETRASLVASGELFGGYHPKMRAVHEANAGELRRIMQEMGWPTVAKVGEEASDAAWLIAQHAISRPALMRAARDAIEATGEAKTRLAYLVDRIATFEGCPQVNGTQFEWNDQGELVPAPIADPETLDARRAALGLDPLAPRLAAMRKSAASEGESGPKDMKAYRVGYEAFAREVGWRT